MEILGALLPYILLATWVGLQTVFLAAWHRIYKFHREGKARVARMTN